MSSEKQYLNGLGFDHLLGKLKKVFDTKYEKPKTGIPKTDLADTVQTSLGKADSALQSHQDISGKQDKLTPGDNITIKDNTISAKDTTYGLATTTENGLMSYADKKKLGDIDTGANKYTLPEATSATLGGVKVGLNLSIKDGVLSATDTTYSNMTAATSSAAGKSGLVPAPAAGKQTSFLRGDGTWVVPTDTTYSTVSKLAAGLCPALPNETTTTKYLRQDGSWVAPPNTTYSAVSKTAAGLCPALPNETTTTKYLRQDGTWVTPPDTNTTYNFIGTTFYSGNNSTGGQNANENTKNGHYYYSSNGPATSLGATTADGALYVQSYSDSWVGQIAQDYRNGRLFVRSKNNGTWKDWRAVMDCSTPMDYTITGNMVWDRGGKIMKNIVNSSNWTTTKFNSKSGYASNCCVSFRPGQTDKPIMVGLNSDPSTGVNYTYLDYALYLTGGGKLEVFESGTSVNIGTLTYAVGDDLRVEYSDGFVKYIQNGVILRKVARAISGKLYADSTFYGNGYIYNLDFGPVTHVNSVGIRSSVTHTDYNNNQEQLVNKNFLSYWNGAYSSSGSSNLAYCNKGAFGSIVTKSDSDYAAASHTHSYAGSSSAGGAATSAAKLNTNAGSATNPVYFSSGVPVACTYSLNKTVPSTAIFTDHETSITAGTGISVEEAATEDAATPDAVPSAYTQKSYTISSTCVPLAGGTMTGSLKISDNNSGSLNTISANGITFNAGRATNQKIDISATDITFTNADNTTCTALKTTGGTMTGSIITPKNDDMGIIPAANNWGQIGSSSCKFFRMYASTFYGDLSGNASSATNEKITFTDPTTGTYYKVPFVSDSAASDSNTGLCVNDGLKYLTYNDQGAGNYGYGVLYVGNSTSVGTAKNKVGMLRLYGKKSGYVDLRGDGLTNTGTYVVNFNAGINGRTVNFPDDSGNLMVTNGLKTATWKVSSNPGSMKEVTNRITITNPGVYLIMLCVPYHEHPYPSVFAIYNVTNSAIVNGTVATVPSDCCYWTHTVLWTKTDSTSKVIAGIAAGSASFTASSTYWDRGGLYALKLCSTGLS